MPNQANFRSDITTQTEPRFAASRIVSNPNELILFEEVPASFAFDAHDTLEVHFYTTPGNQLLLSTTITLSDQIIMSHIVSYSDNSYKNYIRIDFTKLFIDKNLILVPGDYKLVLNFFSDEIGSYTDRRLTIDTISPSRTEVQLTFNNIIDTVTRNNDVYLLREFVINYIFVCDANYGMQQQGMTSDLGMQPPSDLGMQPPSYLGMQPPSDIGMQQQQG